MSHQAIPLRHAAVALMVPFALYAATASRHIGLPDSAVVLDAMEQAVVSAHACNHSLNNLLGHAALRLLPFGNPALKASLASALCGAAAVACLYFALLTIGLRRAVAAVGAGAFMLSHSLWWHSTVPENYALSAALLMACLLIAARALPAPRLLCFLAGLSLFNHFQNAALSVAAALYLICIRRSLPRPVWRSVALCALAWFVGFCPCLAALAADWTRESSSAFAWATGGDFRTLMFRYDLADGVRRLVDWLVLQFPSPFLVFIAIGIPVSWRPSGHGPFWTFLWTVLIVNTGFFLGYRTWDQFSFYLPTFGCLAVIGSAGLAEVMKNPSAGPAHASPASPLREESRGEGCLDEEPRRRFLRPLSRPLKAAATVAAAACLLLPPWTYLNIGGWARAGTGYWHTRYGAIARLYDARYDMVGLLTDPVRHDRGSLERFARSLLQALPPNAILIDDMSTFYQLRRLQQREGARPDMAVRLLRLPVFRELGETPDDLAALLLADPRPAFLVTDAGPCGDLRHLLADHGFTAVPFPLSADRFVWELRRNTDP
jgi:hypothetical protein